MKTRLYILQLVVTQVEIWFEVIKWNKCMAALKIIIHMDIYDVRHYAVVVVLYGPQCVRDRTVFFTSA